MDFRSRRNHFLNQIRDTHKHTFMKQLRDIMVEQRVIDHFQDYYRQIIRQERVNCSKVIKNLLQELHRTNQQDEQITRLGVLVVLLEESQFFINEGAKEDLLSLLQQMLQGDQLEKQKLSKSPYFCWLFNSLLYDHQPNLQQKISSILYILSFYLSKNPSQMVSLQISAIESIVMTMSGSQQFQKQLLLLVALRYVRFEGLTQLLMKKLQFTALAIYKKIDLWARCTSIEADLLCALGLILPFHQNKSHIFWTVMGLLQKRKPSELLSFLQFQSEECSWLSYNQLRSSLWGFSSSLSKVSEWNSLFRTLSNLLVNDGCQFDLCYDVLQSFLVDSLEKYCQQPLLEQLAALIALITRQCRLYSPYLKDILLKILQLGVQTIRTGDKFGLIHVLINERQISQGEIYGLLRPQEREEFWKICERQQSDDDSDLIV